jgi:hypothetical protein
VAVVDTYYSLRPDLAAGSIVPSRVLNRQFPWVPIRLLSARRFASMRTWRALSLQLVVRRRCEVKTRKAKLMPLALR